MSKSRLRYQINQRKIPCIYRSDAIIIIPNTINEATTPQLYYLPKFSIGCGKLNKK